MGVAVTGANRRIGLEFVRSFQRRGDDVVAICRRASAQLHDTGAELVTGVDVGAAAAVDELTRQLGPSPLDVLVNNVRGRKLPFSPAGSDRSPTMPRGGGCRMSKAAANMAGVNLARELVDLINRLTLADTGAFWHAEGYPLPW